MGDNIMGLFTSKKKLAAMEEARKLKELEGKSR